MLTILIPSRWRPARHTALLIPSACDAYPRQVDRSTVRRVDRCFLRREFVQKLALLELGSGCAVGHEGVEVGTLGWRQPQLGGSMLLMEAEELFTNLAASYEGLPGITGPDSGVPGSAILRVGGHIFALLDDGRLVVRLPTVRVEQLVSGRVGTRWETGSQPKLREWLAVPSDSALPWTAIAAEAFDYVSTQ